MGILDGLFDAEQKTHDTIQDALEAIAEQYQCKHTDFFLMIRPANEEFEPALSVYKNDESGKPKFVRNITIKEILGTEEG